MAQQLIGKEGDLVWNAVRSPEEGLKTRAPPGLQRGGHVSQAIRTEQGFKREKTF